MAIKVAENNRVEHNGQVFEAGEVILGEITEDQEKVLLDAKSVVKASKEEVAEAEAKAKAREQVQEAEEENEEEAEVAAFDPATASAKELEAELKREDLEKLATEVGVEEADNRNKFRNKGALAEAIVEARG